MLTRWVLKTPVHLPGLRALFATYPDAHMIILHRDPLEVVRQAPKDHYGPHVYSLVQFGLDHAVERERYRACSQR